MLRAEKHGGDEMTYAVRYYTKHLLSAADFVKVKKVTDEKE